MNLLRKVQFRLRHKEPVRAFAPIPELKEKIDAVLAPPPRISRGRVIKQTRHSEFNPDSTRRGGRIVKVMPHKLQQIKAAQEKVEDDSRQPSIEDLED